MAYASNTKGGSPIFEGSKVLIKPKNTGLLQKWLEMTNTLAKKILWAIKLYSLGPCQEAVACTINIYDRRFYYRNDIGLYYNTLETIVIDDPSLS